MMMPTCESDVEQIQAWTDADIYHRGQHTPRWWLTGEGLLSFKVVDSEGPLFYVRIDEQGEYVELNVQYAPLEVASKKRLVMAMLEILPRLVGGFRKYNGFVFDSESPTLIAFMEKQGFKERDGRYYLMFGE